MTLHCFDFNVNSKHLILYVWKLFSPFVFTIKVNLNVMVSINLSVSSQVVKMWGWFLPVVVLLSSVNQAETQSKENNSHHLIIIHALCNNL